MDYLEELKKKYSYIVAAEEDDDDWENAGYDFLKARKLKLAEDVFSKFCLSQPTYHGGYEGLAYTYYNLGLTARALYFMEKALVLAREFLKDDSIDIEVIEEMEANLESMKKGQKIVALWNKD